MPQITNLTTQALDFVVKGEPKDGVPPTESVQPGETRNVDLLKRRANSVSVLIPQRCVGAESD
jgi:hypothetical protein